MSAREVVKAGAAVAAVVLCLGFAPSSGSSAVIRVPGDLPTIQEAVNAASAGDTVLVASGTYTGPLNRDIDFGGTNLVLVSESGAGLTIMDCSSAGRGLLFVSGEDSTSVLDGFTITGGFHDIGGAVYCKGSSPIMRNCKFSGNRTVGVGGAVACSAASPLIADCVFHGNSSELAAEGEGGALYCSQSSAPVVRRCLFSGNSSDAGGAVSCRDGSAPVLSGCLFLENAGDSGGALACLAASILTIERCTLVGNMGVGGSGIYVDGTSTLIGEKSIIAFGYKGEAVACSGPGGTALLSCCDVFQNEYGDWVGCISGQNGVDGNIGKDPLFCHHANPSERYSLHSDSPCAPESNPDCGGIGALGVGCGASAVQTITWGRVKSLYR
ncbi:hypothetical protein KAW64_03255 [bacterium]|nr:hypothetical protein [bacterium]